MWGDKLLASEISGVTTYSWSRSFETSNSLTDNTVFEAEKSWRNYASNTIPGSVTGEHVKTYPFLRNLKENYIHVEPN